VTTSQQDPPAAPAPAAPPPPAPTPSTEGGNLAARVDGIERKLDELLGQAHGKASELTEAKLDEHTRMEQAVAGEVQRLRDADAAEAQRQAERDTMTGLQADVAALKEIKPTPAVRRIERIMWPGGRS